MKRRNRTREQRRRMIRRDLFWLALVVLVFVGVSTLAYYVVPPVIGIG